MEAKRMEAERDLGGRRDDARRMRRWALAGVWAASLVFGGPALAGDASLLEDLERERAALLGVLLDPERTPAERERYVRAAAGRLADMERIVPRDDGLLGNTGPVVRRAFKDYDLTFLVHASAEQGRIMLDLWLEKVGLTTDAVMKARPGRRP